MRYLAAVCIVAASLSASFVQERSATTARSVLLEQSPPNEIPRLPKDFIKVVKVTLDGTDVQPGVSFQAGDDWFSRLKVIVKNVSAKKIVFATGQLRFPETGDATPENLAVMAKISAGRRPEYARSAVTGMSFHDAPSTAILVAPGQEFAIPVADKFDVIKAAIERKQQSLSSVTTCMIGITALYFDDGTMWLSGLYFRPDPNTPGKYDVISRKDFDNYVPEAHRDPRR